MSGWVLAAAATGAAALFATAFLATALWTSRRRASTLDRALGHATGNLEHLERAFGRFAPEHVVDRLAGGAREIPPERREVTIMFADLRGFTSLSERVDPGVIVPVLNDYFRRMSAVIREHHGHVARIMGDGLMALFGALETNAWHTSDAARAAVAMSAALAAYNTEVTARGLPPLEFGIGVHCGEVVTAVVGSDEMMEFTAMGDAVNVAARIEALTRTHGVEILITEAVRERLDERFILREQAAAQLKGKTEAMVTWALEGIRT